MAQVAAAGASSMTTSIWWLLQLQIRPPKKAGGRYKFNGKISDNCSVKGWRSKDRLYKLRGKRAGGTSALRTAGVVCAAGAV